METNTKKNSNVLGAEQVPKQQKGTEKNAVEIIELNSDAEAIRFFKIVKERLMDVNHWAEIAGTMMSHFFLTDASGNLVQRRATGGDLIKIDIPGPGTKTGTGYDWVEIEEIKEQVIDGADILSMTVRPALNPLTKGNDTAHFLTDEATSTFQVKRIGKAIYAEEHGRNEVPNTDTENTLDNIRNTFVGWGAKVGFSFPQWKALVNGLLQTENTG